MYKGLKIFAAAVLAISTLGLLSSCTHKYKTQRKMLSIYRDTLENYQAPKKIVAIMPSSDVLPKELKATLANALKAQNEMAAKSDLKFAKKCTEADAMAAYAKELADLQQNIMDHTSIKFVDRSRMEEVMKEHAFQQSVWADENLTVQVGKVLNADAIVSLEAAEWSYDYNSIDISFIDRKKSIMNINTMEKFIFEGLWSRSRKEVKRIYDMFPNNINEGILQGNSTTLQFSGIRKSAFSYKEKELEYVCPFPLGKKPVPAKPKDDLSKKISSIEAIKLNMQAKTCTVMFDDGSSEDGTVNISLHDAERLKIPFSEKQFNLLPDDTDYNLEGDFFERYYVELTTWNRGKIKIRSNNLNLSGDIYVRGKDYVIDYKSDKDDGRGKHYFAFFTKDEIDDAEYED